MAKKTLLILVLLGCIGLAALLLIFVIPGLPKQIEPAFQTVRILSPKQQMEKQIKLAFTSAQDGPIINFINLAAKQQDKNLAYQFYVKAFNLMRVSYRQTKSPSQKDALLELKKYAGGFPGYKDSDFVMP